QHFCAGTFCPRRHPNVRRNASVAVTGGMSMLSKRRTTHGARGLAARAWIVASSLAAMGLVAAPAQATVIDLDPTELFFGPAFSQDGFTVTSSAGAADSYVNWNLYSQTQSPNANGDNPTIAQNYFDTFNT